jgi:hypothetical protein
MASPLELLNQASYDARRRGVTYMPPVRIPPPARRGPPITPRLAPNPQAQIGQGGGGDWVTPNFGAIASYAPTPAPAAQGGGGLHGLGWLVGKPLRAGLSALSVLDYPRAAVVAGIRQGLDTEVADQLNRAVAKLPGIKYTPINQAEGDTPGWDWGELLQDVKSHEGFGTSIVEPNFEGSNIWLRRALGLAGDVAADPFTYAGAGVKSIFGSAARAEYADKLVQAQRAAAEQVAREGDLVARLPEILAVPGPTRGYGGAARAAMGETLARAEQTLPEALARQPLLGGIEDVERIGRRGVNIANPEQLRAMGLEQHAIRFGGVPIPGTERISRGISQATAPIKERLTASGLGRGWRSLLGPTGEAGQDLGPAMERILTGRGSMSMEDALTTIKLDQWIREGGSTFRAFASHALRSMDTELQGMSGEERAALLHAADSGAADATENIVAAMGPKMLQAAREAGVRLPEIEGQQYVPHVLSREAFNFLDKMRKGKNPLVDEFRRKMGITSDDLLEEGGFLQKRIFRPDPKTGKPFEMTIGKGADKRTIQITKGDLAELEDKLGGVLREAGFEGKLYETDPIEVWKRYIIATERDVGKRYAANRALQRGERGFYRDTGQGVAEYQPYIKEPVAGRGPGEPARSQYVANPEAAPQEGEWFEYVANDKATERRNREIAAKIPRNAKKRTGLTQREILEDTREAAQARREQIAAGIDETAQAAWNPHREAMDALRKEERAARDQVAEAARVGLGQRLQIDQIDDAIAEADRQITSLQARIGGITTATRRKIDVQSQMLLDGLERELNQAKAERERLVSLFEQARERAGTQVPAAERRAATRAVNEPIREQRRLTRTVTRLQNKLRSDRKWAENYLQGQALDTKTGKSTWISADSYRQAQRRLDDPKVQQAYNKLFEERNAIASRRTQLLDEAAAHENNMREANAIANRKAGTLEEERQLEYALAQKKLANQKKREADDLVSSYNHVQSRISRHQVERDRNTLRQWNKQQQRIDKFSQDIGLGKKVDVATTRQQLEHARIEQANFERQLQHEAAYQAQPPPTTLTEHFERELPKAEAKLQTPEAIGYEEAKSRLSTVEKELKASPEPKMSDVQLPEAEWNTRAKGTYELKTGEGELDRYVVDHIVIPASQAPADYGRVDYWAITLPGEMTPDIPAASLREARKIVLEDRQMKEYGRLLSEHKESVRNLTGERDTLRSYIEQTHQVTGENVRAAERVRTAAGEHTARQAEIESLRSKVDDQVQARLNARSDLEAALQEPEPKWTDPEAEKRADFEARHAEWEARQKSAKSQLNKVKRQLRDMGDRVGAHEGAQQKLAALEGQAAREFENVPKMERPPFFAELEARNARDVAKAGDLQAQLQGVARNYEVPAAEAVAREKVAAAELGRASSRPLPMTTDLGPSKPSFLAGAGVAEEGAGGLPTTVPGVELRYGHEAIPEIASARQRIEELHAGQTFRKADREAVEDAQAEWFAPYNQGLENQRVARARYKEIETKMEGVKQPRSAAATLEGKRGGRPYATSLGLVGPEAGGEAAPGNLAAWMSSQGIPAYEAQPMHRTLLDTRKIVEANPLGDDAAMNKIEAEIGNHLTHLDQLTREYDIPAAQLDKIIKEANNGKLAPVLQRQLKEGFKYLWDGGDVVIDKQLRDIYFNTTRQLESKLFGRTFTMMTDFFKTYATLSPGFHVRNALSAIFMNSSEGVKMATQRDAIKLWRGFIEAEDPVAFMRALDQPTRDAFRATFASGAGGQFLERGVSELRAGSARISERAFANKATRLSQRVGADWVEGPQRLALALHSTRSGMSTTDAINRITRIHFDYGQVSKFDEKAKRVIPFWTFMSRNMPLQFTQMWMKPRTYLHYQSFVRNMKMGVAEDPLIPQYIKQGGGFDTGIRTPGWLQDIPGVGKYLPPKGMPVVLSPDLPHQRLLGDVNRYSAALGGDNTGQVLSEVNPWFTAPFEYAMGQDFFTGKRYGPDDYSQAAKLGIPLAALLSPVGGAKRGADGNWYLQDKAMNFVRAINPLMDRTARLTPGMIEADPENMDRIAESYARFLGAPVRTISEAQKRAELARRYYGARDAALQQYATGG